MSASTLSDPEPGAVAHRAPDIIASQAGRTRAGLAALLFAGLSVAISLAAAQEATAWLDGPVLQWIRAVRSAGGTWLMLLVSHLSSEYATPVVIIASTILLARHSCFWPRYFLAMAGSSTLWQIGLKHLLERPRPQPPLVPYWSGAGYPSGHALTALCVALAWLLWLGQNRSRLTWGPGRLAAIRTALFAWPLLVGFSRVYIDAHWTTDVLGGYALGLTHYYGSLFLAGRRLAGDVFRPGNPCLDSQKGPV